MNNTLTSLDANSVNFREIRIGNIAPNTLYRSSHPIKDNKQEKAISILASKAKINTIINLCDTTSGIIGKSVVAPWYYNIFSNGRVIALGMDFSCTSSSFKIKLKEALQFIIHTEGPWLIHCHAGMDRTGFVCMALESFMGSSLDDVINDYLKSFNSIFESSVYTAQKADAATAMQILSLMSDSQSINENNLQHIAEVYLRSKIGLSAEEVEILRNKLSGKTLQVSHYA
ncbi:MAG: tyrosine-protein phosphatase [Treponema sp.]|nr:tyrosine-protein phosphatase [Treponema sp.]